MDQLTGKEFERIRNLIGEANQKLLAKSTVVIFGLGGVGSFACEGLARSGVGNFIVVDFDKISATNFNRQLIATQETVGMNKAYAMQARILSINPSARVFSYMEFLEGETVEKILASVEKIDFCLEAIDSFGPKIKLIKILLELKIPFISSMGAGGRLNPFEVRTGPLEEVKNCRLAWRIKRALRKEKIDLNLIRVVYSAEKGAKAEARTEWDEGEYQRGRLRGKIGSMCFVPAVFGMCMSYIAVKHITLCIKESLI